MPQSALSTAALQSNADRRQQATWLVFTTQADCMHTLVLQAAYLLPASSRPEQSQKSRCDSEKQRWAARNTAPNFDYIYIDRQQMHYHRPRPDHTCCSLQCSILQAFWQRSSSTLLLLLLLLCVRSAASSNDTIQPQLSLNVLQVLRVSIVQRVRLRSTSVHTVAATAAVSTAAAAATVAANTRQVRCKVVEGSLQHGLCSWCSCCNAGATRSLL
jgi:hypothetical protein